jgi:hypothetical protein
VIRKDISSYGRLDARQSVASCPPYPVSLLSPASFQTYPISTSDDEEAATAFAFVTSAAQPYEAQTPKRTLSARLSRGLSSPVSALHAMNREAEMRGELSALVRSAAPRDQDDAGGVVAARLRKLRRDLKGLVRRRTHQMKLMG